jgi:hypothetical protein
MYFSSRSVKYLLAALSTVSMISGLGLTQTPTALAKSDSAHPSPQSIHHVVYIIMDNVHYSDIAQMPHLMQFLQQGTLFKNDHTILDSHTQDGMLSDMTGKYPDQTGVPDQHFYEGNGHYGSFAFWTNKDADGHPHVTTTPNWVAFNQHGLNVGAIGTPDMELENTSSVTAQIMNPVDPNAKDYLGVAVHQQNGQATFGAPNLPYIYNAKAWDEPTSTLGGFPGWGEANPNWSLQATYEMQTHGVPVTFTYLHDVHEVNGKEVGPGQYANVIQMYDKAFENFFTKLNAAGINRDNTLFVLTTDEGDQYMPQGETSTGLTAWLTQNSLYQTKSSNVNVVSDSGALVYLNDNSTLPQTLSSLLAIPGWNYVADPTELQTLHMNTTAAPDRTPTFVLFAKPDVWYNYNGTTAVTQNPKYVWNHGTISPAILDIWMGMVGPGVRTHNISNQWLDHTDTLPTMFQLLGFNLSNQGFAGVPATSAMTMTPRGIHQDVLQQAEETYMQLNAPVGKFGMATLKMSTEASVNAANDVGVQLNQQIVNLTTQRDAVAKRLQDDIFAIISGHEFPAAQLQQDMSEAQQLLAQLTPAQ